MTDDQSRPPVDRGFGDDGHFIVGEPRERNPNALNWPTVLASAGVAAVVSAIILSVGVVGLHRDDVDRSVAAQPAVVRIVTDTTGSEVQEGGEVQEGTVAADTKSTDAEDNGPPGAPSAPVASAPNQAGGTPPGQADAAEAEAKSGDVGGEAALTACAPPSALPADFTVTSPSPTLDDLNGIVYFLTAQSASDEAKARNIEAGAGGVVVPKTVYNLGLFRAPRGWSRVTGPLDRAEGRITAQLHAFSAGMPEVNMPIDFVFQAGTWRLASSSLCAGVKTVGLPIYCNE